MKLFIIIIGIVLLIAMFSLFVYGMVTDYKEEIVHIPDWIEIESLQNNRKLNNKK